MTCEHCVSPATTWHRTMSLCLEQAPHSTICGEHPYGEPTTVTARERTAARAQNRRTTERLHAREQQRQREKRRQLTKNMSIGGAIALVVVIGGFLWYQWLNSTPGQFVPSLGQDHIARGAA